MCTLILDYIVTLVDPFKFLVWNLTEFEGLEG